MQYIAQDPLLLILEYCDLSICALVCKHWRDLSGAIQIRCNGTECRMRHPKCMLARPFDMAVLAVQYDHVMILKWLLRNHACDRDALEWFCMGRWDLYKNIHMFLTTKRKLWPAMPQTDREFVRACHAGRHILPPFNLTLGKLPLRGHAANHALRYNPDAEFVSFDSQERRLFGVVRYRIDISRQFHDHDFAAIKLLINDVPANISIYIGGLQAHLGICATPHSCNCDAICEWIITHKTLETGCHYQYGMLKHQLGRIRV